MKIIFAFLLCIIGLPAFSQGLKISDWPATTGITNHFLFIVANPNVGTYKFSYANLLAALETDLNITTGNFVDDSAGLATNLTTYGNTTNGGRLYVVGNSTFVGAMTNINGAYFNNGFESAGGADFRDEAVFHAGAVFAALSGPAILKINGDESAGVVTIGTGLTFDGVTLAISGATSGRRIVAFEGDSLVNQALPVWPRSMDSNSVWFARADVSTNWGANGDTLQNMALTYATEGHLTRPTSDEDEGLYLLHGAYNDYVAGRIDSQVYADSKTIWAAARADKYKVVAMIPTGHTNLTALMLSDLTLFDYLVRVDRVLTNTANTNLYYDGIHPTPFGANVISKAVAAAVDGKGFMLVNAKEETNTTATKMQMDLLLNPGGRYVGIGEPSPKATLHLRGTNAGQNILRIDHSDGTPRFQFGTYPSGGDQYATLWGSVPVPNGTNYFLAANTNATVLNAPDSVTLNVGHVVKIYTDVTGVYIPLMSGTGDHVAVRSDGFLMRTNITSGSTQMVAAAIGTLTLSNALNVAILNANQLNLTNALGSNQVRLGVAQLTNVSFISLAEGHSLFYNAANGIFTNAPGGSGGGGASVANPLSSIQFNSNGVLQGSASLLFTNGAVRGGVSNTLDIGSFLIPSKTNYANAFSARAGGTNRLGETLFDNGVTITTNLTIAGTTNQLVFVNTNPAPASAASPTKWISVQISGEGTLYRIPLYQ